MAKKKAETAKTQETAAVEAPKEAAVNGKTTGETVAETQEATKTAVRKPPLMVTVNGDAVSHAHVYKSNQSDDWFFTARLNGVPLRPQKASSQDVENVINHAVPIAELMQKFYPTKMARKVEPEFYSFPQGLETPEGMKSLEKFTVYKDTNPESKTLGRYKFYAQVDDMKMSATATKADLDAWFDRVAKPNELAAKVFGERLHLKSHYEQFRAPAELDSRQVLIQKNLQTNRYEISVDMGAKGQTAAKEISYDDRQSYFSHKTASKLQLAAKYLTPEMAELSNAQEVSRKNTISAKR